MSSLTGIEIAQDYPLPNTFFIENGVISYYDENYKKYIVADSSNILGILEVLSRVSNFISHSVDILAIMGSKKKYLKDIYPLFPEDFDIYIEPFVGGGWVYENKPKPVKISVLNDINKDIYFFFKTLADNPELCDEVAKRVYSVVQKIPYDEVVEVRKNLDEIKHILLEALDLNNEIDKCAYIFIISRISKGFIRQIPKTESYISNLFNKLKEQLKNDYKVVVYNIDGIKLLEEIANHPIISSAFVFLDPPYIGVDIKKYYNIEEFNHKRLFEVLQNYPAKWLMTINEHPLVYEFFDKNKFKIEEYYEKGNGIIDYVSKCLLIRNYEWIC